MKIIKDVVEMLNKNVLGDKVPKIKIERVYKVDFLKHDLFGRDERNIIVHIKNKPDIIIHDLMVGYESFYKEVTSRLSKEDYERVKELDDCPYPQTELNDLILKKKSD